MNAKEELPHGFKRAWLIKTSDGKFYDIYENSKGKRMVYYHRWRLIKGFANVRLNFKEKAELIDEYAEKGYKFSKDFKEGYFMIFKDSNADNKTSPIKSVTSSEEVNVIEEKRRAA